MVALHEDAVHDFTRLGATTATTEASAVGGALVMVLGMGKDLDELWTAVAPDAPAIAKTITPGAAFGVFNFQISILMNGLSVAFGQTDAPIPLFDGMIDVVGSGSALGTKGVSTPYQIFDNTDITVNVLPEPGSLALLGLGLAGLGVASRRRNKKQ
jgi:hypothetical protein